MIESKLASILSSWCDEGIYGIGAQLYVEHRGRPVADLAVGSSSVGEMTSETLHNWYCCIKPLLPLTLALIFEGEDDIYTCSPGPETGGPPVTVEDLISHQGGAGFPTAWQLRWTPPAGRADVMARYPLRKGRSDFSEVRAWSLLSGLIRDRLALSFQEVALTRVLDPLAISDELLIDPIRATEAARKRRVACPIGNLPYSPIPLLMEMTPAAAAEVDGSTGAFASARAMGRLFAAVGRVIAGEIVPGMPTIDGMRRLLACGRQSTWDRTLNRECAFAGGFMSDLEGHYFGNSLAATAIGHAGTGSTCFVVVDPGEGIAMALYLNGWIDRVSDLEHVRPSLVGAIIRALRG